VVVLTIDDHQVQDLAIENINKEKFTPILNDQDIALDNVTFQSLEN
jgi:hypothetical protein